MCTRVAVLTEVVREVNTAEWMERRSVPSERAKPAVSHRRRWEGLFTTTHDDDDDDKHFFILTVTVLVSYFCKHLVGKNSTGNPI